MLEEKKQTGIVFRWWQSRLFLSYTAGVLSNAVPGYGPKPTPSPCAQLSLASVVSPPWTDSSKWAEMRWLLK